MALGRYLLSRLASSLYVLLGTSLLMFILMRLAPGDPIDIMFGRTHSGPGLGLAREERLGEIREELGLDKPLLAQYIVWLGRVAQLDFGVSFRTHRPVAVELISRLPATVVLAIFAFLIQALLAVGFGILSAMQANGWLDHSIRLVAVVCTATPIFLLGLLLLYLFGVRLRWVSISAPISFKQVILPALTLGVVTAPQTMRVLRASLLEEFSRPYMIVGRAKGLSERTLLRRHALPNAILPTVTLLGLSFSSLLGGSVIIETLFSWPGIGKYIVDSIYVRDYPVIQGYVLVTTVFVMIVNLLVDFLYTVLDPRIRL